MQSQPQSQSDQMDAKTAISPFCSFKRSKTQCEKVSVCASSFFLESNRTLFPWSREAVIVVAFLGDFSLESLSEKFPSRSNAERDGNASASPSPTESTANFLRGLRS